MARFAGTNPCEADGGRPGPKRWSPGALGAILLLILGACASAFEAPGVSVVGIDVASLGITGGAVAVELAVTNPNDRTIRVNGLRYRLRVEDPDAGEGEWRTLSEGFRSESVTLEPRDTARVAVEVPFEYRAVGAAVRSLLRGREISYRLDGEVRIDGPVGEIRVPVRRTGVLTP